MDFHEDINFLDAVIVNETVYRTVLRLQSEATKREIFYQWRVFLDTGDSYTNIFLDTDSL